MEIILSNQCKSLTGSFGRGFGYHIQRRKNGFFAKRNTKGDVPPDGHWRFIATCACLAQNGLHIADIKVSRNELGAALFEAGAFIAMQHLDLDLYNARDIINLKNTFNI